MLKCGGPRKLGRLRRSRGQKRKIWILPASDAKRRQWLRGPDRLIVRSVDAAERAPGLGVTLHVSLRASPCTARPFRFQHQLPAERNDPAAHAGATVVFV